MKLAQLKKNPLGDPAAPGEARIRGTDAQDVPLTTRAPPWRRYRVALTLGGSALVLLLLLGFAFRGWLGTGQVMAGERLRLATVTRGHFVRDVAADGAVVAAVNPTLFAVAPGTVSYAVRAGDPVQKGQLLATLESPEITNELQREQATLDSLDAALAVRAPVDGMVANLAQPQRTRVAADAPLLTVVDLSAFEIEFQVAETYARDIKPGMPAEVTVEGRAVPGTVTAISPEVRQNQVVGRVKFRGPQPRGLRQNERTAVHIVLDERDGVLKFERGPFIDDNARALYVVRGTHAVRVPVVLGAASVTEIEVIRGLAAGDEVVISDMRDADRAAEVAIAN